MALHAEQFKEYETPSTETLLDELDEGRCVGQREHCLSAGDMEQKANRLITGLLHNQCSWLGISPFKLHKVAGHGNLL